MRFALSFAILLHIVCSARAGADGEEIFARNYAMLVYAQKACPSLRINTLKVAQEVAGYGLPASALRPGGRIASMLDAQLEKLREYFAGQTKEHVCSFMEDGFGPGGTIADGFLKRR